MRDQPSHSPPPEDVLEIGAPEQFAALAHPLRQRLLFALGHRPATVSRLAAQLDAKKGNVAHHLKVLREAGLIHIAETRQVRGGTEQYYQRTARHMVVAEPQAAGTAAMLAAVAQELDRSPVEPHLTLRHLRLSPAKAKQLGEALAGLVDDAEEDGADGGTEDGADGGSDGGDEQPVHGALVVLYQQASPTGSTAPGSTTPG
ncbi:ArsR/SmtB family transcription factor [Streptomyces sp. NBC_00304]|uniref:ArsR/SmtB family transcription factor n=1 Tax=Streptomyces sp. NBC_00304 TaxID=2975706 RepID=UPI002E2D4050|nr:winged helix-turn-helix domain-containing protein [Streptomyces sp. NBC_00304]